MRGGFFAGLAAAAFSAAVIGASPATACVWNPVTCIGGADCRESEGVRRARSAETTRLRLIEARERLRNQEVDFAAELAHLLVPNIRPVFAYATDCGPMGEADDAQGRETEESLFQAIVQDTPFEGRNPRLYSEIFRDAEDFSRGEPCNSEFRARFAAHLRRSIAERHMRAAWTFLSARLRSHPRLTRFEGDGRVPPLGWRLDDTWLQDQVERYLRRTPAGRSLAVAMRGFWTEQEARLGDDVRACPRAAAEWEGLRRRVLVRMTEQDESQRRSAQRE